MAPSFNLTDSQHKHIKTFKGLSLWWYFDNR